MNLAVLPILKRPKVVYLILLNSKKVIQMLQFYPFCNFDGPRWQFWPIFGGQNFFWKKLDFQKLDFLKACLYLNHCTSQENGTNLFCEVWKMCQNSFISIYWLILCILTDLPNSFLTFFLAKRHTRFFFLNENCKNGKIGSDFELDCWNFLCVKSCKTTSLE